MGRPKIKETHPMLLDGEWLKRQYVELKRSTIEIASLLGVHYADVSNALKGFGVEIRSVSERQTLVMLNKMKQHPLDFPKLDIFNAICYPATPTQIERAHERLSRELPGVKIEAHHSDDRDQIHRFVNKHLSGASIRTSTTISTSRFGF